MKEVNKKKRSRISILLCLILAGSLMAALPQTALAEEEVVDGYQEMPYDDEAYTEEEQAAIDEMQEAEGSDVEIPESYGSVAMMKEMYPATRNQGSTGTCWAHSAIACAEFDMVTEGVYSKDIADFSETQLAYITTHGGLDKMGNLVGDDMTYKDGYLDEGNNMGYVRHIMSLWKGVSFDTTYPWSSRDLLRTETPSNHIFHVSDAAKMVNSKSISKSADPDDVKAAIMEHGAVSTSYYHASSYFSTGLNGDLVFYNSEKTSTNHAVAMVGWDDNFSVENWPESNRPSKAGAWLIRNSHASRPYFWISYEDTSHRDTVFTFDYTAGSTYDNLYQYDSSPCHVSLAADKIANVFTVQGDTSSTEITEKLEAVMLTATQSVSLSYKIEIYLNPTNASNPTSGELQEYATTYASTTHHGAYTTELENPVYLRPGDTFAVVVTNTSSANKNFDIEYSKTVWTNWSLVAHIDAGQSFYVAQGGSTWKDASSLGGRYGNICLKAISNNVTDINELDVALAYDETTYTGTAKKPAVIIDELTEGKDFTVAYEDNVEAGTAKVIVTGIGDSYAGTMEKTFTIKPRDLSTKTVTLSYSTVTANGTEKKPTVKISGLVEGTDFTVDYEDNILPGIGKAIVTGKGNYGGTVTKTFVIEESAEADTTADAGEVLIQSGTYDGSQSSALNSESLAAEAEQATEAEAAVAAVKKPATPKGVGARLAKTTGGYNDAVISWKAVAGADGYYVYYGKNFSKKKMTKKTTVTIKDLQAGKKHSFRVAAYVKAESGSITVGSRSSKVNVTTLKKVAGVKAVKSGTKVKVSWKNINGETGYQISKSTKKAGTNIVATYKTTTGKYKKVAATKGKTYYYKVRAYKVINGKKVYGPWSNVVKLKRK